MTLGTPLSKAAVKVMLLGSGELGKEVIIELQRLGVETIAVDRYANAPAQQVAQVVFVVDRLAQHPLGFGGRQVAGVHPDGFQALCFT